MHSSLYTLTVPLIVTHSPWLLLIPSKAKDIVTAIVAKTKEPVVIPFLYFNDLGGYSYSYQFWCFYGLHTHIHMSLYTCLHDIVRVKMLHIQKQETYMYTANDWKTWLSPLLLFTNMTVQKTKNSLNKSTSQWRKCECYKQAAWRRYLGSHYIWSCILLFLILVAIMVGCSISLEQGWNLPCHTGTPLFFICLSWHVIKFRNVLKWVV